MARNRSDHPFGGADLDQRLPRLFSNGLCQFCKERPATLHFGDMLTFTHGGEDNCCQLCCAKMQLAHAVERAKEIPELTKRVEELEAEDDRH